MGCTEAQDKRSKEVSFFIKYVNLTKLHYMDESPLRQQEIENNPIVNYSLSKFYLFLGLEGNYSSNST